MPIGSRTLLFRSLIFSSLVLAACARPPRLSPFSSDGCTLFPDRNPRQTWCACCVEHDLAYWKGGADSLRRAADSALGACVLERTGDSAMARMVYAGTRAGGSGYFPTWYRWGYGWPYGMRSIPDSVRGAELRRQAASADRAMAARKVCDQDGPEGEEMKKGPAGAGP
jgi:hypothetical protein